jgi:uncharacterized membrane protein YphA (DoxX/SURF4 family)
MTRLSKALTIALRLAIGWHFLYEGVYKLHLDDAWQQPATARYYVAGSVRRMQADTAPDPMLRWSNDVARYFKDRGTPLGDAQKIELARLRQTTAPQDVDWIRVHDEILAPGPGQSGPEGFSAEPFLRNSWGPFRPLYRALIADTDGLERLTAAYVARSLDQRYTQLVAHYHLDSAQQARLAAERDALKQEAAWMFSQPDLRARLADYRVMLASVRQAERTAWTPYARERAQALRARADSTCAALLTYATEPADELVLRAGQFATVEQLKAGPPPTRASATRWVDLLIPWTLVLLGVWLMSGIGTLPAAIGAACLLASFYFAMPPWPGLPVPPGDSHFLIVDRNLIELLAVLAVAKGAAK